MNQSKIEQQVMASVGVIYAARKLTSRFALSCYALALSFLGTAYFVSLPHVLENLTNVAGGGVGSIETFFVSAVLGTKFVVQIALLVGIGALAVMAIDLAHSSSQPSSRFA